MEYYEAELNGLIKFTPEAYQIDEQDKIQQFLNRSQLKLYNVVKAFELNTYVAIVNKAKLLEQGQMQVREQKNMIL